MAAQSIEPGPVSQRLATQLPELRASARLTLQSVSDRLSELGNPIAQSTVSKIEHGRRRVDVDDLVALALAVGVTPNRLLLTGTADAQTMIGLTPTARTTELDAWRWMSGQAVAALKSSVAFELEARFTEFPEDFTQRVLPHAPSTDQERPPENDERTSAVLNAAQTLGSEVQAMAKELEVPVDRLLSYVRFFATNDGATPPSSTDV